jgi:hypothetical protein
MGVHVPINVGPPRDLRVVPAWFSVWCRANGCGCGDDSAIAAKGPIIYRRSTFMSFLVSL